MAINCGTPLMNVPGLETPPLCTLSGTLYTPPTRFVYSCSALAGLSQQSQKTGYSPSSVCLPQIPLQTKRYYSWSQIIRFLSSSSSEEVKSESESEAGGGVTARLRIVGLNLFVRFLKAIYGI